MAILTSRGNPMQKDWTDFIYDANSGKYTIDDLASRYGMQIETVKNRIRKLRHAGIKIDMPQTINDIAVDKRRRDFINEWNNGELMVVAVMKLYGYKNLKALNGYVNALRAQGVWLRQRSAKGEGKRFRRWSVEPLPEKPKPPAPQITDDIKSDIIMRHKRGVKPFVIAELNDIPINIVRMVIQQASQHTG